MIRKRWMIKTGVVAMILCLLLAACAPEEEDREFDDDNEVSVEDRSDDGDEDRTEDERDGDNEEEKNDDRNGENTADENNLSALTIQIPLPEVDDSALDQVTYISTGLLDVLNSYIRERDGSALAALMVDRELTDAELEAYSDDPVVVEHIRYLDEVGGIFLLADGDNDGIDDLFAWYSDGGSLGNSTRHFLKGQADGSFICTAASEGITQELFFGSFDDTVYLIETGFDYNRKVVNGFIVSLYRDGEILETLTIAQVMKDYTPEIVCQAAGYEKLAEKYAEEGRSGFWVDGSDELCYGTGSAETLEDKEEARNVLSIGSNTFIFGDFYRSDFDNNGVREWYTKYISYPGTMSGWMYLGGDIYQEGEEADSTYNMVSLLRFYSLEYEGDPLYFWVDTVGDKQIVLLLSYQGLYVEYLNGYLIEEDHAEKVLEIVYTGNPVISYQGINVIHGVSIEPEEFDECPVMSGSAWIG